VGPLDVLPSYLINYPSGLPVSAILKALRPYTAPSGIGPDQYMMNGLYNIFLQYRVLGFPIAILFLLRKDFTYHYTFFRA